MERIDLDFGNNIDLSEVLLNSSELALFVFDSENNLVSANKAGKILLGINSKSKSVNSQKVFDFRISEIKKELSKQNEITKEINILDKDKSFITTKTVFVKIEQGILAISTPISQKNHKNNPVDKLTAALSKISEILNSSFEQDEILEIILDGLNSILDYDKSVILFLDGDGVAVRASRGIEIEDGYKSKPVSKLIRSRKTILENVTGKNKSSADLKLNIDVPYSYIAAPLVIRETLFGIIIVIKEQEGYFSKEDAKIVDAFGSSAAYSVKDAELSNVFKLQLKILKDNVVERTKTLEVIKEQNLKILESDRLKNEFLANMSHELRTPLNAIIGLSEALKLKIFGPINEKQEEYVDDIHASGIHLLGMINDLLDLAKIEANEMHVFKKKFIVYQAVNEVISVISALANQKNIEINVLCNDKTLEINADYRKFQQIMYNLLSNATKFSHEGGKIEVGIAKNNSNLEIYVKDNGIGIAPEFHEKIFEKFRQVDSSYTRKQSSTGLGLTITRELVRMHGGEIRVESELDKGATFIFTLPFDKQ